VGSTTEWSLPGLLAMCQSRHSQATKEKATGTLSLTVQFRDSTPHRANAQWADGMVFGTATDTAPDWNEFLSWEPPEGFHGHREFRLLLSNGRLVRTEVTTNRSMALKA